METTSWATEHSNTLRELFARGRSFSEIADVINDKFDTNYSRSAVIGRARRLGLDTGPGKSLEASALKRRLENLFKRHPLERRFSGLVPPRTSFEDVGPLKLRCVEVQPRHVGLVELEQGDCRYPYGGDADAEPITFCGHPRRWDSSYCAPHFQLSRNRELPAQITEEIVPPHRVKVD